MMHWCRGPPFPVAANQRPERTGTLVNVKPARPARRQAREGCRGVPSVHRAEKLGYLLSSPLAACRTVCLALQ